MLGSNQLLTSCGDLGSVTPPVFSLLSVKCIRWIFRSQKEE